MTRILSSGKEEIKWMNENEQLKQVLHEAYSQQISFESFPDYPYNIPNQLDVKREIFTALEDSAALLLFILQWKLVRWCRGQQHSWRGQSVRLYSSLKQRGFLPGIHWQFGAATTAHRGVHLPRISCADSFPFFVGPLTASPLIDSHRRQRV